VGLGGITFYNGTFEGGTANIQVDGSTFIGKETRFISTKGELQVNDFYFEPGIIDSTTELLVFEEILISSEDVSRKYAILSQVPNDSSNVVLDIEGGLTQEYGVDYYVEEDLIKWDGKTLESDIAPGDILRVIYTVLDNPEFLHNRGTVVLNSIGNTFYGSGINLFNLNVRLDGTNNLYCQIDSSAYIDNMLTLESGNIKAGSDASGIDSTLFVRGDIDVKSIFGAKDYRNTAYILVDGDDEQVLSMESGGILPTLTINKTTSNYLTAQGTGPISVFGDLILTDGTFNTNGLDIKVGTL
jgi:hypothetical protein